MKNVKKISKRLNSLFLVLIIIVSSFGLTTALVYAWEHPEVNVMEVELYDDQDKTYSSSKSGPNMYYEGKNKSEKNRNVYFQMQYFDTDTASWEEDVEIMVTKGTSLGQSTTNTKASDTYWRLKLYTKHISKEARAVGWMW